LCYLIFGGEITCWKNKNKPNIWNIDANLPINSMWHIHVPENINNTIILTCILFCHSSKYY